MVASVSSATLTLTTDLTAGDASASTNCVIVRLGLGQAVITGAALVAAGTTAIDASQSAGADTITLASADSTIVAGQKLRLADGASKTCGAAPMYTDLEVGSVSGAVITFATDITAGDVADAAVASIDAGSANSVTLGSADASIVPGSMIQLADKSGQTCGATPKGSDLRVASVSGAVLTLETDLTAGDGSASSNCVVNRLSVANCVLTRAPSYTLVCPGVATAAVSVSVPALGSVDDDGRTSDDCERHAPFTD